MRTALLFAALSFSTIATAQTPPCFAMNDTTAIATTAITSFGFAGQNYNAWQFTPRVFDGRDHGLIFVLPADAPGRYDYIEIFDSSNVDGWVEIAQLGIGPIDFVPSYNAAYGLKDGFVSFGGKERSSGGTLWTDQQRVARNVSFVLEAIDLDNGDSLHELERYVGTTEQVLYLPDLHDAAAIQRYGMRGTLDELSALDYPYYRLRSMPLRITQD